MTKPEKALDLYAKGYNCAQAVLGVFCEEAGLEQNIAFRLTNGFGGGMRCGEVCGAVTGAVAAIGLLCGFCAEGDFGQKGFCNQKTYEFITKFKEENGSLLCRELLGADVHKPEDHNTGEVQASHKNVCPHMIQSAVRLMETMTFTR